MDEVEQNASSSDDELHKRGAPDDQFLAEPAHVCHQDGEIGEGFESKVTGRHGVHGIDDKAVKPEQFCGVLPVDGVAGGCECGGAERAEVDPCIRVAQPVKIPGELLLVGEEVMGEGGGLGVLHVGEPGHDRFPVLSRQGR